MTLDYFNERASIWDSFASEKDTGKLERMSARLCLKPGMTVLDIGTGTGVFLLYLTRYIGATGRVIALDIAKKMLEIAQGKCLPGRIDYLCANVMCVPLEPETCDAVVCYSSFPHFQDKPKALLEIKRVLRTGGRVYICHTSSRKAINEIHRGVPLLCHDLLPDRSEMIGLLYHAGFMDVMVEDDVDGYFATASRLS